MSFNPEKLAKMAKPQNEEKKQSLRNRRNDNGLRISQDIALLLHYQLRIMGITQAELAKRMGVSPVFVHRIMSGFENLTIDTIAKIECALNTTIVSVPHPYEMTILVTRQEYYRELDNNIVHSDSYSNNSVDGKYMILNSAA